MGGCQNQGPFSGTLNIRCRIVLRTQKGAIILTTTQTVYTLALKWSLYRYFRVSQCILIWIHGPFRVIVIALEYIYYELRPTKKPCSKYYGPYSTYTLVTKSPDPPSSFRDPRGNVDSAADGSEP